MYFLYRHIRQDKNEVFYIGIGTIKPKGKSLRQIYKRAFTKRGRNRYWQNVVAKTDYVVELMLESDSRSFIEEKEREFILLYGRRDLGTGTLVNMVDGCDLSTGRSEQSNEETTERLLKWCKENKEKHRQSILKARQRLFFVYDPFGNYVGSFLNKSTARDVLGISMQAINNVLTGYTNHHKGFRFFYEQPLEVLPLGRYIKEVKQ